MTADSTPLLPGFDDPVEPSPPRERPRVECEVCGEQLTAAESRLWGVGRRCRHKLGLRRARRPGRFDVEQEELPGL